MLLNFLVYMLSGIYLIFSYTLAFGASSHEDSFTFDLEPSIEINLRGWGHTDVKEFKQGLDYFENGNWDRCINQFYSLELVHSKNPWVRYWIARCSVKQGKSQFAREQLKLAIELSNKLDFYELQE